MDMTHDGSPSNEVDNNGPLSNTAQNRDNQSNDNDSDGHVETDLNAYSFFPTTVPPFVLESNFVKTKMNVNDEHASMFNKDHTWSEFAHNVGSNVAYTNSQRLDTSRDPYLSRITTNTSISTYNTLEKTKIKKEILNDLNSEWGGQDRLDGVFDSYIKGDYKMNDENERNEYSRFINKIKKYYYGNIRQRSDLEENLEAVTSTTSTSTERRVRNNGHNSNQPDWIVDLNSERKNGVRSRKKNEEMETKIEHLLLDNHYLPLFLRCMIIILCVVSLALAVRIFQNSDSQITEIESSIAQQPSTIMAICVNSVAVFYTIYIAHDEFSGKPIGLRNPVKKLKLIMLDLLFIIFASANLALAFNTRYDKQWVCASPTSDSKYPRISYICRKQKALSAFLFVLLFMWILIFTVSIIRVVEKVSSANTRNERD
ncbi:hypothetical protein KAFR_0B01140 [Kazachstania africana CBS 2517]|uniref:Uncharacterized protein n=1 Tax=Kazachstania africana (strain ATCC 22294 / BCRC 22015 / CBS 2517 / CECT 1963 / NBRC 1671 / NRRL Y-8276) TaxID=1071382 RepID=H2APW3_KAZAF|nr:hypothetical protein KAFR_0B01140 [Kazachstania africana CBS 2517]CCF56413.1 hypothetical protein KAFR_0B01140 [Kazachstania africana CBS 2517]